MGLLEDVLSSMNKWLTPNVYLRIFGKNFINPIRTGGVVFHQAGGFLPITLEVINVYSRNLVTFPKL